MNLKEWITTNWFALLICASLAFVGEHVMAITLLLVWEFASWTQRD